MTLDLDDYKSSFMVDSAVILFKKEPDIVTIEKLERLLKEVANEVIRKKMDDDWKRTREYCS